MNYEKIGEFIQEKRKEKNLTQSELARKLGVTDKAVSKWERGLGCPDVSILEVLSKELDISILELLKGRKIENEVIKITEADDYIKTSINESRRYFVNRLRNIINNIIIFMSFIVILIFLFLNLKHYINMNQKAEYISYIYSGVISIPYDDNLKKLNNNYLILKDNQGNLSDEEYNYLLSYVKKRIDCYSNNPFYKLGSKQKEFKLLDFYTAINKLRKLDGGDIYITDLDRKYSSKENYYIDSYESPFKAFDQFMAYTYDEIISLNHSDYGVYIDDFEFYLWDFDTYFNNSLYIDNATLSGIMEGAGIYE